MDRFSPSHDRFYRFSRPLLAGALIFAALTICTAAVSWITARRIDHLNNAALAVEPAAAVTEGATSAESDALVQTAALQNELENVAKQLKSAELRVKAEIAAREGLRKKLLEMQQALAQADAKIKTLEAAAAEKAKIQPDAQPTVIPAAPQHADTDTATAVPEPTAPSDQTGSTKATKRPVPAEGGDDASESAGALPSVKETPPEAEGAAEEAPEGMHTDPVPSAGVLENNADTASSTTVPTGAPTVPTPPADSDPPQAAQEETLPEN